MWKLPYRIAALLTALGACLSISASARDKPPVAVAQPQPAASENIAYPALWKVEDADTTIYLFGTIHALPKGIEWYGGPVAGAFESSNELVTEITESSPEQMRSLIASHAMLPRGETLRMMLTSEVTSEYEKALAGLGMPAQAFDAFEPWYAAIGLSTLPLVRQGYTGENGVEATLDTKAKVLGHPHTALETAEYQIGLFDSLPLDLQKRYFADVVTNLPKATTMLAQMVEAWRKGDAETLASLMNADEDDPALIELLLISRNRNWAGWIEDRMKRPGRVFLAVGAGHLAGPGSVQEQLAKRGITSIRVQ